MTSFRQIEANRRNAQLSTELAPKRANEGRDKTPFATGSPRKR
jgi:hypothetical protein